MGFWFQLLAVLAGWEARLERPGQFYLCPVSCREHFHEADVIFEDPAIGKIIIMELVLLKDIYPGEALKEFVLKYQVFKFFFEKEVVPPVKFHAPRPEHSITFYVRDPQTFSPLNCGPITTGLNG